MFKLFKTQRWSVAVDVGHWRGRCAVGVAVERFNGCADWELRIDLLWWGVEVSAVRREVTG